MFGVRGPGPVPKPFVNFATSSASTCKTAQRQTAESALAAVHYIASARSKQSCGIPNEHVNDDEDYGAF